MELTPIQREILTALINLYRQNKSAIKGEIIAEVIDRNPGTVRNQMQSLKALGLVEGVPGPKGGYKATGASYAALNVDELEMEAVVPIYKDKKFMEGLTAAEISFTTVRHPDTCNGIIRILGDIRDFDTGNIIQVGPTPVNKLIVRGKVMGRDDSSNALLFSITEMVSLPKRPIKDYLSNKTITIPANATIQEAARIFTRNNIHGAPVEDKGTMVGVITFTDIGNTLASGKVNLKIREIMSKEIISVDGETPLYDVVKVFDQKKVGRLMVTDGGRYIGIISKTDVLHEMAVY
ncbi:MAG: CBS domain-containing protein [ANME-2 cluster archaeon]|nr:CBS domain-containing protein [ANME-2 cluster archaeon]